MPPKTKRSEGNGWHGMSDTYPASVVKIIPIGFLILNKVKNIVTDF